MATARKKATTRKSTAKRKSASARGSAKKVTAKAEALATKPSAQVSRYDLLKRFHLFSAAISLIIAGAAVFLLNNQTANFTTVFSAKDPIASGVNTVLGPTYESLFTVEVRYLVATVFAVSAILSLLLATGLRSKYEAGIKNSTSGIRWLFAGVSSALILELASILAGLQDVITLKLVAGLVLATTALSWMVERDNKSNGPKWAAFAVGSFTGFLAWLPLVAALGGTAIYGTERFGWHVYAIALLVLLGFARVARSLYLYIKYPRVRKDYLYIEEKYLSNELFIKLSVAAVVFIALIK